MKTTFLNTRKEDRKEFRNRGHKHLQGRASDFIFFMNIGTDKEGIQDTFERNAMAAGEEPENLTIDNFTLTDALAYIDNNSGDFNNYGLSIDYQLPERCKAGYLRYQLSWGGPSDEIRFYFTHGANECHKIEYVFLDWGTGVGFDVTNSDWAVWLFDWFNHRETVKFEVQKALENR